MSTWDWQSDAELPVRVATTEDTEALAAIYRAAVEGTRDRSYSPQQVRAWLSLAPTPDQLASLMTDGRLRLVATDEEDQPVGFVDLKPDGHVHYLYVHPDAGGSGLGATLLSAAVAAARRRGLELVYAEASEAALRCFLRQGFRQKERRDFSVAGVGIHNYAVELPLYELLIP
jgi:putative acetyltransferase